MNDSEKSISTVHRSKSPTKKRGRPSRNGRKEPWQFVRALMVTDAHKKAREHGEKHRDAVKETVDVVRQLVPKMRISETEVRRILAEFRPQDSQVALTVDYSILEGDEAAKRRKSHAQMLELAGTEVTTELTDQNLRKSLKIFKFGFGKRPNYHRHNAKTLNP